MNAKTILAATIAPAILSAGFAAAPATAVVPASASAVASVKDKKPNKRTAATKRSSRAAGMSMRTKGTRFAPTTAANRLEKWAKRGTSGYHNQCLRLADNAYQPKGNRTSTSALSAGPTTSTPSQKLRVPIRIVLSEFLKVSSSWWREPPLPWLSTMTPASVSAGAIAWTVRRSWA